MVINVKKHHLAVCVSTVTAKVNEPTKWPISYIQKSSRIEYQERGT